MSDEGERTCPLCAEEMDLTDQQLKPCKCGYEICVWCWHHILDMAEKDDTEGRCPACRSPYDKEKIVGMAANCERLVAEVHMEKKMKNQKAKSKSSEARKQLSSVRVIQRNLVYIVGLPLNLADEDLLQQREYFGQYGKVLKVSMSRTAAGVVQQFPNSTCSVYITYSKEEEAIRCIKNVHGFVLEGRPLRACFGTTKYCHAWLRNMPCSNPDCLYLHEIGSQEDSFTKDEIISAYTRSRVQQITGAANNMQRRTGDVLPPPLDDCTDTSSGKPTVNNVTTVSIVKGSPPNGSSGRPISLSAAAWGTRATNCQPAAGGLLCANGLSRPKPDTINNTLPILSAVEASLNGDVTKRPPSSDGSHSITVGVKDELLKPDKQYSSMDNNSRAGERTSASDVRFSPMKLNNQLSSLPLPKDGDRGSCTAMSAPKNKDGDRGSCTAMNAPNSIDITGQSCSFGSEEAIISTSEETDNLSCNLSSIYIDRNSANDNYSQPKPISSCDNMSAKPIESHESQYNSDKHRDVMITNADTKAAAIDNEVCNVKELCDLSVVSQSQVLSVNTEVEDDVTTFDNQRLKDPEVVSSYLPKSTSFRHVPNHSHPHLLQHGESCNVVNAGSLDANYEVGDDSLLHANNILCNGYSEKSMSSSSYGFLQDERNEQHIGSLFSETVSIGSDAVMDKGENNIISNILSMEFDAWGDSVTSPQSLAKLLGDKTDKQNGSLKKCSSWKIQSNNQSRFSFARQEESKIQANVHASSGAIQQYPSKGSLHDFVERDFSLDKLGITNGFPSNNLEESGNLGSGQFFPSNNKLSAVSRAQISVPPGFSVPNRAPPPGFSSLERTGHAFDSVSGDIEFMDPAILAVGKGRIQGARNSPLLDMRSNYPEQLNYLENEARVQLLMQRSLSPQQNLRFSDIGNSFSQFGDSYGISSRLNQSQVSNLAPFPQLSLQQSRNAVLSNGQLDGWNEVQTGNSLGVAELLRNERLGFNKFYRGYDEPKYRIPNSRDLYNRTFGI
ncbi:CCR4-NOT transcription complex subunit 4 [Vigna unguiculata]|uniref:CCR4-NOT transcription complex subunit 4 n=1 Tax=Vigna unguiculata TaxID=3917 RepID=A0A4D6N6C9_VIGUN|nr:CCR4-NOT transcription complex subunit 4 [Vigna unguiculata]